MQWLYDIDEPTRALTFDLVSQTASTLAVRRRSPRWFRDRDGNEAFVLRDAVRYRGHSREATFSIRDGYVTLHIQANGDDGSDPGFSVSSDVARINPAADPVEEVVRAVASWASNLSQPIIEGRRVDLTAFRLGLTELGTAVLSKAFISCKRYTMCPALNGAHQIVIWSTGYFVQSQYIIPETFGTCLMTPELVRELDLFASRGIHVYDQFEREHGYLPMIMIGSPREVDADEEKDPLAIMRAIEKLKTSVRLAL